MGQTPFFLVYGSKAVLPVGMAHQAPRIANYSQEEAEQSRAKDVDMVEEARLTDLVQQAHYLQSLWCYHDQHIQKRSFNVGDMVLHKI
jgi:hypothetical protein